MSALIHQRRWVSCRSEGKECCGCGKLRRDGWRFLLCRSAAGKWQWGLFLCWFCAPERPA